MTQTTENPPAFPHDEKDSGGVHWRTHPGMSLRDWFAGQAIAGGLIQGSYPEWQLRAWFGDRGGVSRKEIASRAAYDLADAMLAARGDQP